MDVQVAPGRGYPDLPASYARLGIAREVGAVIPSFTAAGAIVAATDYVVTLPASLVEVLGPRLGIRAVGAPVPPLTVEIKLALPRADRARPRDARVPRARHPGRAEPTMDVIVNDGGARHSGVAQAVGATTLTSIRNSRTMG